MIKFAKSCGLDVIRAYVSMQYFFPALPSLSFDAQSSPEFRRGIGDTHVSKYWGRKLPETIFSKTTTQKNPEGILRIF